MKGTAADCFFPNHLNWWKVNFNSAHLIAAKTKPFLTISILKFISYSCPCLFYLSKICYNNHMLMGVFEPFLAHFK